MARQYATQEQVVNAIRARLIDKVPEFHENTCFVTDEPVPATGYPHAQIFATVSIGDGTFPPEFFAGGGDGQVTENGTVVITTFSQLRTDNTGEITQAGFGAEKGLISRFKPAILAALLKDDWEPVADKNELLRNQLYPVSCSRVGSAPISQGSQSYLNFSITFGTDFDWQL